MRGVLVLSLLLPLFAVAQTGNQTELQKLLEELSALQSKVQSVSASNTNTQSTASLSCPSFLRTLKRGSEGEDVRELQKILTSGGYLTVEPTGYFGALTEKGLQEFQKKAGLVSGGTPETTGFGVFGPKTRAYFAQLCSTELQSIRESAPKACAAAPALPTESCAGAWQKVYDSNRCESGWSCIRASTPNAANRPPVISAIDGPTNLVVGTTGTWTVGATDPEGGALQYSAIWGDEGATSILAILAGVDAQTFTASPRLSHVFASPGTYAVSITVRDGAGQSTSARLNVAVAARTSSSTATLVQSYTPAGSCVFAGTSYTPGTETEGYTATDLCLSTGGVCLSRASYIPKFKCTNGTWREVQTNPYPNLPDYASFVGAQCGASGSTQRGATKQVVVAPSTIMCRDLLCATVQNYSPVTLTCEYEIWVDWGVFSSTGTTTSSVCANPTPCEYRFGDGGKACAAKQNGVCPTPKGGHPLGN